MTSEFPPHCSVHARPASLKPLLFSGDAPLRVKGSRLARAEVTRQNRADLIIKRLWMVWRGEKGRDGEARGTRRRCCWNSKCEIREKCARKRRRPISEKKRQKRGGSDGPLEMSAEAAHACASARSPNPKGFPTKLKEAFNENMTKTS